MTVDVGLMPGMPVAVPGVAAAHPGAAGDQVVSPLHLTRSVDLDQEVLPLLAAWLTLRVNCANIRRDSVLTLRACSHIVLARLVAHVLRAFP